jgi:hypothetical protein
MGKKASKQKLEQLKSARMKRHSKPKVDAAQSEAAEASSPSPAMDDSPAADAPLAVDAPPAVIVPAAATVPSLASPAVDASSAAIVLAAAAVPSLAEAPMAANTPPAIDALTFHAPAATDASAAADSLALSDAPPAADAPPTADAPPIANAPALHRKPRGVAPTGPDGVRCDWDYECGGWRHAGGTWHSGNRLPTDPRVAAVVARQDAAARASGHVFGCSSALGCSGAANPFTSAGSGSEAAHASGHTFGCSSALARSGAANPFASADVAFGCRGADAACGVPAAAEPPPPEPMLMQRQQATVSAACKPRAPLPLLPLHTSRLSAPRPFHAPSPLADIPVNTSGSGIGAIAKPRGPVPVDPHGQKCSWDGACGVWRDSTGAEHAQYQADRKRKAEQTLARQVREGSVRLLEYASRARPMMFLGTRTSREKLSLGV